MFVQVYAYPFIGEWIMNIQKWEVGHNVHTVLSITEYTVDPL